MSTKKIQIIGNIATKDDVVNIRSDISSLEVAVDGKANQSTTLDGYGITDAYTKTDGEALAKRVDNAESVIEKLNGSEDGSVRKQISDALTNANLGQYAQKSELDELSTVVADKANTADLPVNVSELNNDAQYQTATDLAPIIDRVGTLESDIGTKASASSLATHMVDNMNPHSVTAEQTGALPLSGGILTGILYTDAPTPLLIGKSGKVGMRAATSEKSNVGQINISNAWYGNGNQWGSQISAYNGETGQYNELRVSHDGVQYNSEDGVAHTVVHDGNINNYISDLASTSSVNISISNHNTSTSTHSDIRGLIAELTTKLNNFLDVDDTTTDQLSEVITLINNNKGTLESLTTSKINVSDIVNNLTTNSSDKVLSAAQGVAIKSLIDALQTEVDGKANSDDVSTHIGNKSNPHGVTIAQLGITATADELNYMDGVTSNVQSQLNSKANTTSIPTKTSQLTNDSGFKTTDNNTTYTLTKSGSTITLTGSDGKTSSVTDADTDTVYTHPTSSGNKHIPSGGSSGQILRWSADGTAAWGADNNTTYGVVSTTADGLAPKRDGSTSKFLRADGTWAVPPDNNTVYTHPSTHPASMITGLATVATSGSYNDLSNKPTIPTKTSQLTNDSGFKTTDTNTHYTTGITTGASGTTSNSATSNPYIKIKDDSTHRGQIQIKGSGATSVSSDANGVITISSTDNNTVYTHPGSHPASMITGLATVATSGKYSDLSNKPTIPTKTSQLTNDSGFKTTDNNTTYTLATGDSNGQIKVTPSSGSAYNVAVKGLGSAAYTSSSAYATASHEHTNVYDTHGSAWSALNQAKAYTDSAISTQLGTIESALASI